MRTHYIMNRWNYSLRQLRRAGWAPLVVAAVMIPAFGVTAPVAHAAALQPASCESTATSSATVSGWIGGDMNITLAGQHCGQSYSGQIDHNGNVTLPSAMLADTYTLTGSQEAGGTVGACLVWSITCTIANDAGHHSTFTLDSSGSYTISGYVYCNVYIGFDGSGSFPIGGIGSGFGGSGSGNPSPPTATPELSSSALLTIGLAPTLAVLWYRRRKRQAAASDPDDGDASESPTEA